MDEDALITWTGDDFPSPLRKILNRFAPGVEPEILAEQGWWPLLVRLDTRLASIVPDYILRYARPQDGQLQFEVDPLSIKDATDTFMDAIRGAEAESRRTCEVCGRRGQVRTHGNGVYTVLCDEDAGFIAFEPPILGDEITSATAPPDAHGKDAASAWSGIVGACYTATTLGRVLGYTEDEIAEAANSLHVLAVTTTDGITLYPQFQVWDGQVVDGLAEVLQVLCTGTDSRWTWAQWLNTAIPGSEPGPSRHIDELHAGLLDVVLRDAEHDAAAWRA